MHEGRRVILGRGGEAQQRSLPKFISSTLTDLNNWYHLMTVRDNIGAGTRSEVLR